MGSCGSLSAERKEDATAIKGGNHGVYSAGQEMVSAMESDSDQVMFNRLLEMYTSNPDKFDRLRQALSIVCLHEAPLFGFEKNVADVKALVEANMEDFKAKFIDSSKKDPTSEEGKAVLASTAAARKIQYTRWRWAQANIDTYINQLRVSGFSDEAIQNMLDGVPLCFENRDHFQEFCAAGAELCHNLSQEQTRLLDIHIVATGSSVTGFSQNPLKGKRDQPTKMTSVKKSDVDICIVADGVSDWISRLGFQDVPFRVYPSTAGPNRSSNRYGLKPSSFENISQVLFEFYQLWSEKLTGGLQITFQDKGSGIPPWEIVIVNGGRQT